MRSSFPSTDLSESEVEAVSVERQLIGSEMEGTSVATNGERNTGGLCGGVGANR